MLRKIMQLMGIGKPNKKVHDAKNWYTSQSVQVQTKTKKLQHKVEENEEKLQRLTAYYRVGVASGRIR